MRLALGASRARLAWQLMIEAAILSGVAVIVAMPVAWVFLALRASRSRPSSASFRASATWTSPRGLLDDGGIGALATHFRAHAGVADRQGRIADTLRQGSRATTAPRQRLWLRNSLAAAQVALTLALLSGSALMLSAENAVNGPLGFDKRNLLNGRLILPDDRMRDAEKRRQFVGNILARLQTVPAVADASMVSNLPYGGSNTSRAFYPARGTGSSHATHDSSDFRRIAPRYFETMGIPFIQRPDIQRCRSARDGTAGGNCQPPSGRGATGQRGSDRSTFSPGRRTARTSPWSASSRDILHDWFEQLRTPTVYRPLRARCSLPSERSSPRTSATRKLPR